MTKIIDTLALSGFWAGVKTRLNNKADASHSHVIADVASLQTLLDGKANSAHTHTIANVTGLQTALDGKSDTGHTHSLATTTTAGHMSGADKSKLDGIAAGANNYSHPATHPPSIIATDSSNRFVSDAEKSTWNSKASTAVATSTTDGLYPKEHFAKVDAIPASPKYTDTVTTINGKTGAITKSDITALGIPAQDTVYTHPSAHPASMITQDTSRRMVSDAQIANWDGNMDPVVLMSETAFAGITPDPSKIYIVYGE